MEPGENRIERTDTTIVPRWLDVDAAAHYLCMSRHALYHRVSRRQIPHVRQGRLVRFDREMLDRWMSKGVKYGAGEARRHLVLRKAHQRHALPRVHGLRRQEVGGAPGDGDRARDRAGIHGWRSTIPSFAEWWAVYRKTYTPQKASRNRDLQIVARFLPHFGARPLDSITKSDIVRYLNLRRTDLTGNPGHKHRRPISESTVRRERGLLQAIFERAIEEGHEFRDPRRDIDWQRGTVHVTGKFRKERDVPMQPDARAALDEQFEEEGTLWRQIPQRLREVLAEGCARAKVPTISPHVLRHTYGTRWLQAGGDIYKLSRILGHASVSVTEAHYVHLLKEDLVAASEQVKIPIAPRGTGNVVRMPRRG